MSGARCALVSAEQDEPMLGTAPEATAFLLVEVRGSWAGKILASELPDGVRAFLATLEPSHPGLRLQFIRAPRRTSGPIAVYLCRVGQFLSRLELDRLDDLAGLDVSEWLASGALPNSQDARPLTLVCTHGRRDVCCALQGVPLFDGLVALCGAESAANPQSVWQTSHLGGHRFAPVVLSLPDGHLYGRLTPDEAEAFLTAQREGRVHDPARLRGCSKDSAWAQAASVAYRQHADERAFDAVLGERDAVSVGTAQRITIETHRGAVHVDVEQELRGDALRPLSCGDALSPTTCWRATVVG